jgi:hypothetical protein
MNLEWRNFSLLATEGRVGTVKKLGFTKILIDRADKTRGRGASEAGFFAVAMRTKRRAKCLRCPKQILHKVPK